MINSRDKGVRGELEFAAFLHKHGVEARRGQQRAGGGDSPDVISAFTQLHWEVKRVQAGNPYDWLEQAQHDANKGSMKVVAHRRNNKRWIAVTFMDELVPLLWMREALFL